MRPTAVSSARCASAFSTGTPSSLARAVTFDSIRSVRMEPGHTLLTRMPSRPTSSARLFAKATTPMRVAPDSARLGIGWYNVVGGVLLMGPAPGGPGGAGEGRAAGGVHEHVEAPEPGDRRGDQVANGLGPVQVARKGERLAAGGVGDLLGCLLPLPGRAAAE